MFFHLEHFNFSSLPNYFFPFSIFFLLCLTSFTQFYTLPHRKNLSLSFLDSIMYICWCFVGTRSLISVIKRKGGHQNGPLIWENKSCLSFLSHCHCREIYIWCMSTLLRWRGRELEAFFFSNICFYFLFKYVKNWYSLCLKWGVAFGVRILMKTT